MYQMVRPALAKQVGLEAVARAERERGAVTIRYADADDATALRRLAVLDTAPLAARELPGLAAGGRVLLAEVDGRTVAALAVNDGLLVRDPFSPTAGIARLLRSYAADLARRAPRPSLMNRLRPRLHH